VTTLSEWAHSGLQRRPNICSAKAVAPMPQRERMTLQDQAWILSFFELHFWRIRAIAPCALHGLWVGDGGAPTETATPCASADRAAQLTKLRAIARTVMMTGSLRQGYGVRDLQTFRCQHNEACCHASQIATEEPLSDKFPSTCTCMLSGVV
jgi:hypothetical protein